jgi:outer membrane protein OmpA-like peptidoglycan-associated protein
MKPFSVLLIFLLICTFSIAQDSVTTVTPRMPGDNLTTIYFDFDKHVIRTDEKNKLDDFISKYKSGLIANGIVIKGHTDVIGSDRYNDLLARRRTFTVHEYLLNNGVPKTAVTIESFGEKLPVNENRTRLQRQLNRRVELYWADATVKNEPPAPEPKTETPKKEEPVIPPVQDFSKEAMDTVKEGDILRLRNINFYGGRHTFLPTAIIPLEELLEVMKSNPKLVIEIQGHICCRPGSDIDGADFDANDNNLSHNRARAVYEYLVENGISKKRMSYRGFAGSRPLVYPEYTEEDRTANRRVEIRIVSK